jgi:hypothetical protein
VAKRKSFLLRIDPRVYGRLQKWADDELRSVNGQIEYLLRDALRRAGRLPRAGGDDGDDGGDGGDDGDDDEGGGVDDEDEDKDEDEDEDEDEGEAAGSTGPPSDSAPDSCGGVGEIASPPGSRPFG